MHCRSVLLLDEELKDLQANPLWGVALHRVPQHQLVCFGSISGLKSSIWEDAIFHVTFYFSEHYNEEPPEVVFNTIPFHPNVHPESGKMIVEFLSSKQEESNELNLVNLLVDIQELLSNPILDNAVNEEAKELLLEAPQEYEKMVQQCVNESRRLHTIFDENILEHFHSSNSRNKKSPLKVMRQSSKEETTQSIVVTKPKQVSFDVYHRSWIEMATSKPFATSVAADDDEDHVTLQMWHPHYSNLRSFSPASSIRVASHASRSNFANLPSKLDQIRKKKLEKMEALKQLYLNKPENNEVSKIVPISSDLVPKNSETEIGAAPSAEGWENEADELLAWTSTLNAEDMLAS